MYKVIIYCCYTIFFWLIEFGLLFGSCYGAWNDQVGIAKFLGALVLIFGIVCIVVTGTFFEWLERQ